MCPWTGLHAKNSIMIKYVQGTESTSVLIKFKCDKDSYFISDSGNGRGTFLMWFLTIIGYPTKREKIDCKTRLIPRQ